MFKVTEVLLMKQFNLGLFIIAIASKWWLLVPVLAFIAGALAFIQQQGSQSVKWTYIVVCAIWGGGFGILFFTSALKRGKGVVAPLLSAFVMVVLAVVTGLILTWEMERTLAVSVVGLGLGLIAPKWITHLNLG